MLGVPKPFHRVVRQLIDSSYANGGNGRYVKDVWYAADGVHYVRTFLLLQKDFMNLLDYIEPADTNESCYSHRIHELLLRTCVEVEANCKAILVENGYSKKAAKDLNMTDYRLVQHSHRLSEYKVRVPSWRGNNSVRHPFDAWSHSPPKQLSWYADYNATKHDRHSEFSRATFGALVDALCGLAALMYGQFLNEDFGPQNYLTTESPWGSGDCVAGGFFWIYPPPDWPQSERYEFDWQTLSHELDRIQNFDFDSKPSTW